MCFAILSFRLKHGYGIEFQFPFRRDVLCNLDDIVVIVGKIPFQFPFRRDVLCNHVHFEEGDHPS